MFFGQTFVISDLAGVAMLVLLEALLSADNALVLAIMVKHLPKQLQQKALLYGLAGAFVFRLIAILAASIVLSQWWLQAIGAAYLLYLPIKHFMHKAAEASGKPKAGAGFWQTVIAVELTDIAFALDSVLAGIGFISTPEGVKQDKIWVVYVGAIIGIILLRFAASLFVRLLERFPSLDHVAYILVGWVGVKLGFHSIIRFSDSNPTALPFKVPHPDHNTEQVVFWGVMFAIIVVGGVIAYLNRREITTDMPDEETLEDEAAIMETVEDLTIEPDEDVELDQSKG